MRRAIGFGVFVTLLGAAVFVGLSSSSRSEPPTYELREHGHAGRNIRTIVMRPGDELCWELALGTLPRAMQLHHDVAGPSDPVVTSFYDPPASPRPDGCALIEPNIVDLLIEDPDAFYVDGHDTVDEPPVTWVVLLEE